MNRILVATDMSERSERAVHRASRLAQRHGVRLDILAIVDEAMPTDISERIRGDVSDRLERSRLEFPPDLRAQVHISVLLGDPRTTLHQFARKNGADLIVLGLHRDRGLLDVMRETTMEFLIRTSPRPVLLVRDPGDRDYQTILSAIDTSQAATHAAALARDLAPDAVQSAFFAFHVPYKQLAAGVAAQVHANPYRREAEAELRVWKAAGHLPNGVPEPEVIEGSVVRVLQDQIVEKKPDLLTAGAHARSGPARWILGGFTADLIRDPPCDLLITRPKDPDPCPDPDV